MKKEYTNGEITIVWEPDLCIHSGICVKLLPNVYHPKERPWIQIDNATTEQLEEQVKQCPSGALSCYNNADKPNNTNQMSNNTTTPTQENPNTDGITDIEVTKNGPLIVKNNFEVMQDGKNVAEGKKVVALCRCGASKNKPFCDGMHLIVGFKDGSA